MTVVYETSHSLAVDDHLRGHAPQFEELDFLPVQLEHRMRGVGQAYEGQALGLPIAAKGLGILWPHNDDHRAPLDEPIIVLAQLRQVPPAEWSREAPVKDQNHMLPATEIG